MSYKIPKIFENQFDEAFLKQGKEIFKKHSYQNFDFVRQSFCAQFPDNGQHYWTFLNKKKDKDNFNFRCDCRTYLMHQKCSHVAALFYLIFSKAEAPTSIHDSIASLYSKSIWAILAKESYELYNDNKVSFETRYDPKANHLTILFQSDKNENICQFELPKSFWARMLVKYRHRLVDENQKQLHRLALSLAETNNDYSQILYLERTDLEERMNFEGYKSWQQKFEESVWFDFGKIWFLSLNEQSLKIVYHTQLQQMEISDDQGEFRYFVHRNQVATILDAMIAKPELSQLISLKQKQITLNYSLTITDSHDLKISPTLFLSDQDQPLVITKENSSDVTVFGKYIHLNNQGFFPFERAITYFDSSIFNFNETIIPNEKIPKLLTEYQKTIQDGKFYNVSPSLKTQNMIKFIESAEIVVNKIDKKWYFLDVKYQVYNESLSFNDIYHSIKQGKRYLIGKEYWIDLKLQDFEWIYELNSDQIEVDDDKHIRAKLNQLQFHKLRTTLPKKNQVIVDENYRIELENLINFKSTNIPELSSRKYKLRDYQNTGFGWLWFLYENNFSGLLCDDMGLGKTYQSLALIDAITIKQKKAKFLIVCPTSVISHWENKLTQLQKRVAVHVYHGSERELNELPNEKYSVILTSYGIMRNDLPVLEKIPFELMIFDEIQLAKNKNSLTNAAINQLKGRVKIGLTGTPIENTLNELKALFDVVLPNYLGSDGMFKKRYIEPIELYQDKTRMEQLHRIINPFILRRTKSQVLSELPPKIEELRRCELSPDQVKLYRDIINTRAKDLLQQLNDQKEQIPYMHVFAVLNYLKQICNHPAQLETDHADYNKYQSGKWELFCELLDESLNSGFKVVVFSQYLQMLKLIEAYLTDRGINFATIKGSTERMERAKMVDRFNNDPNCMVFTGSLKASGLGIDLIGGSVVIHYDRWWNAAREDQATDRVHRIGQTRGVQVFKLITEGTLEEKIDRIIERKKDLSKNLIKEDDADMVKHLSRDELVELLTFETKTLL
jgi:SNF2 family DNA or RNA helicase